MEKTHLGGLVAVNVGPSENKEFEFGADHGRVADAIAERSHHDPFIPRGVVALHLQRREVPF